MRPLVTSGTITQSETQIKHYLHAILFSCVASKIANFVYLVIISGSNHLAPSIPFITSPLSGMLTSKRSKKGGITTETNYYTIMFINL